MSGYDYDAAASQYDAAVKEYGSYSHDVIFGMCYEFVKPGEKLLDLGIGTGLASIPFHKAGLKICGLDNSEEMLGICRARSFAEELFLHELPDKKFPFAENTFNHIISSGLFHFLGDLKNAFSEAERVMKNGGIFAFTFSPDSSVKEYITLPTGWGIDIRRHSPAYIRGLLEQNNFFLLKEQRLLMKGADKINYEMIFSVMVTVLQSK